MATASRPPISLAAAASGGYELLLPCGTYKISSIAINNGIVFSGASPICAVIVGTSVTADVITITGGPHITNITIDRNITSHQTLTGNYSFLHVDPLDRQTGGSSTNVNLLMAGYAYQINPTLLLRATAGAISGSESAFSGSLAVEKQLGGVWFAAGYQRYLGFFAGLAPLGRQSMDVLFANGLVPNSVYQVFSLRASGQLTRRVSLEGVAQKAINRAGSAGGGVHSLIGQLKVSYHVTRQFAFFVRAEHYGQNVSPFSDQGLSRNRYMAGVEIALSKPPEKSGARDRRAIPAAGWHTHQSVTDSGAQFRPYRAAPRAHWIATAAAASQASANPHTSANRTDRTRRTPDRRTLPQSVPASMAGSV